jgi:pimeloyl-ACP methyl ester carboxylesterase
MLTLLLVLFVCGGAVLLFVVRNPYVEDLVDGLVFVRSLQQPVAPAYNDGFFLLEGVHCLVMPPSDSSCDTLIMYLHGNGVTLQDAMLRDSLGLLRDRCSGSAVVASFDYRGYGRSSPPVGRLPMADVALSDAIRLHEHLHTVYRPTRLLIMGNSLGCNVAIRLAAHLEVNGRSANALLLQCPFLGTHALRMRLLRYLPDMVSVPEDAILALKQTRTVIVTGAADTLIDNAIVRQRLAALPHLNWVEATGADHNSVTLTLAWERAVQMWSGSSLGVAAFSFRGGEEGVGGLA